MGVSVIVYPFVASSSPLSSIFLILPCLQLSKRYIATVRFKKTWKMKKFCQLRVSIAASLNKTHCGTTEVYKIDYFDIFHAYHIESFYIPTSDDG